MKGAQRTFPSLKIHQTGQDNQVLALCITSLVKA